MFLYLRLVLAHLVADYPLQTNRVYFLKISGSLGQMVHAGIHTITYLLCLLPFWNRPSAWIFVAVLSLVHYGIDILKVYLIDRSRISPLLTYTMDQVLHLTSLAVIFLFPISREIPPASSSIFFSWYWNDRAVFFLICFLFATYFTTYFLECWRVSRRAAGLHVDGYTLTPTIKYLGIWERGVIMILTATGSLFYLAPLVLLLRAPVFYWMRRHEKDTSWLVNYREMLAGLLLSMAAGFIYLSFAASQN